MNFPEDESHGVQKRDLIAERKLKMTASISTVIEQVFSNNVQLREQIAVISKSITPFLEARQRLMESIGPAMELAGQVRETMQTINAGLSVAVQFGNQYRRWIESISNNVVKAMELLPEAMQNGLLAMAQEGWYLDPEMSFSAANDFQYELEHHSREELHQSTAEYFRLSMDRILEDLKTKHPNRAAIIQNAFDAHRAGLFNLSIPVLLIQADGICQDLTNRQLFSTQPKKGLKHFVFETDANWIDEALLHPLRQIIQVNASLGDRPEGFDGLNRHMVLHGESVGYGTEINGLKAISLINFISFALRRDSVSA